MTDVRCAPAGDAEIHYFTGPEPGAECECGAQARLTDEQKREAKAVNFVDWLRRQPGARREH